MDAEDWLNEYRKLDWSDLFESYSSTPYTDIRLKIKWFAVFILKCLCLVSFSEGHIYSLNYETSLKKSKLSSSNLVNRLLNKTVIFLISSTEVEAKDPYNIIWNWRFLKLIIFIMERNKWSNINSIVKFYHEIFKLNKGKLDNKLYLI